MKKLIQNRLFINAVTASEYSPLNIPFNVTSAIKNEAHRLYCQSLKAKKRAKREFSRKQYRNCRKYDFISKRYDEQLSRLMEFVAL